MDTYYSFAFLLVILALPYPVYRLERRDGETIGEWINRTGDPPFDDLHRTLILSRWVRPRWLWRYCRVIGRLSYMMVWMYALIALGFGLLLNTPRFNVRNSELMLELIHFWGVTLFLVIFFLFFVFMVRAGEKDPGFSWRRTGWYSAQMAVIGVVALQIYGAVVRHPQLKGLESLMVWRPAPPTPDDMAAEDEARKKALWDWMDAWLEGPAEGREKLWTRLPPGFDREELQGLIDRISRFKREQAKAMQAYQGRVIEPHMVAVPRSLGLTGCVEYPDGKPPCPESELPARMTEVAAFAIAAHEVTFAEWDACYVDDGCDWVEDRQHAEDAARGQNPVTDVSWDAAQRYIVWLNKKTGKRYRLPGESEWEIAARAGGVGRHNAEYLVDGELRRCEPPLEKTSCLDRAPNTPDYLACSRVRGDCPDGVHMDAPRPAGSFPPNRWGLHDMTGNVAEWVQDCWSENLLNAPQGGGAVDPPLCAFRTVRGGSYSRDAGSTRPSYRYRLGPAATFWNVGFRLAQTVEP